MTIRARRRLRSAVIPADLSKMRQGFYSDRYFLNIVQILQGLAAEGYRFDGESTSPDGKDFAGDIGNLEVEAQYFNRRAPRALVAGVDAALALLRYGTGYYDGDTFVETWDQLDVEAVPDGVFTYYDGDPLQIQPVLKVRGRYRDFVLLETQMLGVLSRASRVATNVYHVLEVSNGKPVLFFPARFDIAEAQLLDGYAYDVAVQCYNRLHTPYMTPQASTDAQAAAWGGVGGGTVPHALIASFLGDTAAAMVAYARHVPVSMPRIALVDFNNDVVGDSLATLNAYWPHYEAAYASGDSEGMQRWTLHGVRIDTSGNVRDKSIEPDGPYGINPSLIHLTRTALDHAWQAWDVPAHLVAVAQEYCQQVQIVASGGFDRKRIEEYEAAQVPVDVYGVGSRFFRNDSTTNVDYSMDLVRVKLNGQWVDMAKFGRQPCDNPDLMPVDLREVE